MYIKDIMTKDVITVKEEDNVEKCANLLIEHDLSGLPVLDNNGKVKGIVTEGDLIRRAARMKGPATLEVLGGIFYLESPKHFSKEIKRILGTTAGEVMTRDVITVKGYSEIEAAATLLVEKKIKRLPVVDEKGNILGIVSRKDIMNHLF